MRNITRRALLANALIAGSAVALAGCTTVTAGGSTSVTLDVAKVTAYANAGLNALQTIETALLPIPALTVYVTQAQAATALLQTALNAFSTAVGDKMTVSYSDASIKSLVDSVLADIDQVAGLVGNAVTALLAAGFKVTDTTVNSIQVVKNAIMTIASVFRALLTTGSATTVAFVGESRLVMSEQQALRVLAA